MARKIFISTAEPSGDLYASLLVEKLKELIPGASFFGVGGERMKKAGVSLAYNSSGRGAVGLIEILSHLPSLFIAYHKILRRLKKEKPDLAIFIDSQGFNMPLAVQARKQKITTVYYIAPQEWLWGTEKGINKVTHNLDLILAIFKDEYDIYKNHRGNVIFCGHPLLDVVPSQINNDEINLRLDIDRNRKVIGILPGNRKQEINSVFPIMLDSAELIKKYLPEVIFLLPVFSSVFKDQILSETRRRNLDIRTIDGHNHEIIKRADVILSTPGTVTMECAIIGTPALAIYKLHPLTYFLGKHLLKIKLPFFTMPSLLAQKKVIPEFIQDDAQPSLIANEAINYLTNAKYRERTLENYKIVKEKLGAPGSITCAAREIANLLRN